MGQVISRHNKQVSSKVKETIPARPDCNCQKAHLPCIMGGKCVPGNVIYQGAVTRKDTGNTDFYTGLSEPSWKLRYGNHKQNFKVDTQKNRTATCLAKHIWMLKDKNVDYTLKFKQLAQASAFNTAVLKGKGAQWQEIARFARLYATYFYLDPLVL